MDRRAPIAIAIALAAGAAFAAAPAAKKKTVALHLRALDRSRRRATVEVANTRAPAPNLFTFTDERGRHFVAVTARCQEEAAGVRVCELEIPVGYEKHPLASLVLHLHGLHGRTVAVPESEIERANAGDGAGAAAGAGEAADGGTP